MLILFSLVIASIHSILKKNLPYSQMLHRIRRNCSLYSDFVKQARILMSQFRNRDCFSRIVKQACYKAKNTNRSSLLVSKNRQGQSERIIIPVIYDGRAIQVSIIIRKHWHLLSDILRCGSATLFVYHRSKNLRDMIGRSRLKSFPATQRGQDGRSIPVGSFPCGGCCVCSLMLCIYFCYDSAKQKKYSIRAFFNCNSKSVIYAIKCSCDIVYVGYTSRPIKIRICEHRNCICLHRKYAPFVNLFTAASQIHR